ncbi:hypothetical protein JXA70_09760 [candidate division KSB1 bacterium]|nr:hypothetical protein [candidate division KSB1 bacterium]
MSDFFVNGIIIILGVFFFGLMIYGFYIVLKPAPKGKGIKPSFKHKHARS